MTYFTEMRRGAAAFLFAAAATLCLLAGMPAAAAWAATENPCELTDETRAQYEADGTLAERIAYVESLNDNSQSSLIAAAQQRESGISTASSNVPSAWVGGMGTTGNGYILCVAVEFPAEGDEAATTFENAEVEAKSAVATVEGDSGQAAPYESLQAYYQRSSYGKLNISCRGICYNVTAKHCRSYYTKKSGELLTEIATTLDTQYGVDFAQYDGNDDGYVDGFYLIYAGDNTGWGSTWWPHCSNSLQETSPTLDGKKLKSGVFINDASSSESTKILIHETGHVLGLEDYYSHGGGTNGINTIDMMSNNTGDHNAFSKWLLGWIDDDKITRIAVTESGIKVRRGTEDVQTYTGNVTESIKAFTTNNVTEGGGFIAVSSDESILTGSLFCEFYLLQYDHPEGNQAYSDVGGLISGLRIYRVQSQLNGSKTDFAKSCSNASYQHDMLIEALKPSDGGLPSETGDAFHTGAIIGVTTKPSTNFREDALGYTGIHIEVTNADNPAEGNVTISHEAKSTEAEFTISPAFGTGIQDTGAYCFEFSVQPNWTNSFKGTPTLVVDGKSYNVKCLKKSDQLMVYYELPTGTIKQDSTCELVFPAGYFDLYGTSSEEMHVALIPRSKTIAYESSGTYGQSEYDLNGTSETLSNAVTVNGEQIIVAAQSTGIGRGTKLNLLKLSSDGKSCDQAAVEGGNFDGLSEPSLTAIALNDGRIFVWMKAYNVKGDNYPSKAIWIDPSTGKVLDSRDISDITFSSIAPLGNGVALLKIAPGPGTSCSITQIFSSDEGEDKQAGGTCGIFAMQLMAAGDGRIAAVGYDTASSAYTLSFYSVNEIEKLFDGLEGRKAQADLQLTFPGVREIEDMAFHDGKFYVLTKVVENDAARLELHVIDGDGNTLRTTKIEGSNASSTTKSSLIIDENGAVAIKTAPLISNTSWTNAMEIAAVDPDGNLVGYSSTNRNNAVFWADGRLYVTNFESDSTTGKGKVAWTRTAAISGETPAPEPKPNPEPEPDATPEPQPTPEATPTSADNPADVTETTQAAAGNAASKAVASPQTSDAATTLLASALAAALASLFTAAHARRKQNQTKGHS